MFLPGSNSCQCAAAFVLFTSMFSSLHKVFAARFRLCFINIWTSSCRGWSCVTGQWPSHLPGCSGRKTFHRFLVVLGELLKDSCLSSSFLVSSYPCSSHYFGNGFPRTGVTSPLVARSTPEHWRLLVHTATCLYTCLAMPWCTGGHQESRCRALCTFYVLSALWATCSSGLILR